MWNVEARLPVILYREGETLEQIEKYLNSGRDGGAELVEVGWY